VRAEALEAALGRLPAAPLEEGVADTTERFRELGERGLLAAG
jgi:hypothetical protein